VETLKISRRFMRVRGDFGTGAIINLDSINSTQCASGMSH
jgi:hypothetical protein